MRTFKRAVVVSALAVPLLASAAGMASADESSYCHHQTSVSEHGAWSDSTCSQAHTGRGYDYNGRGYGYNGFGEGRYGLLGGLLGGIL